MTKRAKRLRTGSVLLGLALAYPAWLAFIGVMQARTTKVHLPLVSGKDVDVPVHVGWDGRFTLKIVAATTDGADRQGTESCLLDLPDPHSQPVPCAGVADRLHLNFRVENGAGQVVAGNYGLPMAGKYQDRNREYAPFLGDKDMGNELLVLEKLDRGDYRVLLGAVHVPAGLEHAQPRVVLEEQGNLFAFLSVLPLLGLSAVLALAAVVMLLSGAPEKEKPADGG